MADRNDAWRGSVHSYASLPEPDQTKVRGYGAKVPDDPPPKNYFIPLSKLERYSRPDLLLLLIGTYMLFAHRESSNPWHQEKTR